MGVGNGVFVGAILMLGLAVPDPAAAQTPLERAFRSDIDHLCRLIPERYAYFAPRSGHWGAACAAARSDLRGLTTPQAGLGVIERLLDALYDPHIQPNIANDRSPRVVPSGSDLVLVLAEDEPGTAMITGVRRGGGADFAGLRAGDRVLAINERTPLDAAMERIRVGRDSLGPKRLDWALNAVAAGRRTGPRQVTIRRDGISLDIAPGAPIPAAADGLLTARMIGEQTGYVRFNDSLGTEATVAAFTDALETLRGARSWILDLRDTPSGGDTSVAEPILGRFIAAPMAYQRTVPPGGPAVDRLAFPVPGEWTAEGPLVVLVGGWTGSMGEGMAVGFDGMGRGVVMGTPMAGLAGGIKMFMLPATQIPIQFPVYDLTHVDGTPRDQWRPPVLVASDPGGPDDPALQIALEHLKGMAP